MQTGVPKFELIWREEREKYYVTWREGGRLKRVSAGTADQVKAKRFLADFIIGWLTPTPQQKAEFTVTEIVDRFIDYKLKQYKERFESRKDLDQRFIVGGIRHFNSSLTSSLNHVKKHLGDLTINELNNGRIKQFVQIRLAEGVKSGTAKKSLDMLVAAMNRAKKDGLIEHVPYVEKPPSGAPREKWATTDQVKQLINGLAPLPHLRLFAILAMHTLSRKRAILELRWNQVDFENRRIHFNPMGRVQTNKRRVPVPINNILYDELLKARQAAVTNYVIEFRGQSCYEIGRAFRNWAREIGLGWITPHVLRHTGATLMAQQGVSMWEIAGIMGDRVDTVEKHYLKHHPDYLKHATAALEKLYA